MTNKLYTIFMLLSSFNAFCQTGPGGVGTTDGLSRLEFWFDANDLDADGDFTDNPANLATITAWSDKSGNGRNALSVASNRPVYLTSATNNFPGIYFRRNNDRLNITSVPIRRDASFYIVFQHRSQSNTSGSNLRPLLADNGSFGDWGIHSLRGSLSGILYKYPNTSNLETIPALVKDGNPHLASLFGSSGTGQDYIDNRRQGGNTNYNRTSGFSTSFFIGSDPSSVAREYTGYITEVIGFSSENNAAQKIIIANYLAAKYNFNLSTYDIYDEDDNGNYDFEVAGIGRVNSSNIHNSAQGTGIVSLQNPSGLSDNEFLIWGHDNGALVGSNTTDVPATVLARFDRVWRVSEVNISAAAVDVGTVDIRFDLTGLGTFTPTDLSLLVDSDNDGSFDDESPIYGATHLGGNLYEFAAVSSLANNLRFTLGTVSDFQINLPIELLSFEATPINNKYVQLNWQTSTEINNDYFTAERSTDGITWNELNKIDGAGNSSSILAYSTIDNNPSKGISYYRLKQTDFEGKFSYSTTVSVSVGNPVDAAVKIYPNPSENLLNIVGNKVDLETINLYNELGQNMPFKIQKIDDNGSDSHKLIDVSTLKPGVYYIVTKTTANKIYRQ
jgi:hypothetical protein